MMSSKQFVRIILLQLVVVLTGCVHAEPSNKVESVMSTGMTISATIKNGEISIHATSELGRSFTWSGSTRSVRMLPRKERWQGSLGLYYPGPDSHWEEHDGITRGVLEEGYQNFDSIDDALAWIKKKVYWGATYRGDGLLVSFHKSKGAGGTLHVGVWQILVENEKPIKLPGSDNSSIFVLEQK
ncbi:MAG: hypothetical protein ABFS08_13420 [Pseudomonadota bacterium]